MNTIAKIAICVMKAILVILDQTIKFPWDFGIGLQANQVDSSTIQVAAETLIGSHTKGLGLLHIGWLQNFKDLDVKQSKVAHEVSKNIWKSKPAAGNKFASCCEQANILTFWIGA